MMNETVTKRFSTWFPGKSAVRDRWGDPISQEIGGREFHGNGSQASAAERMRWSLGHA